MIHFNDSNENNIHSIISIVKLASLLFSSIIIYNRLFAVKEVITIGKNGYFNAVAFTLLACVVAIIYCIWAFFSIKIFNSKSTKKVHMIENFFFIIIFSVLIVVSNTCESQYKFLFLFIIITSTIQLGMKSGIIMAVVSSAIILIIDLVYGPSNGVNVYFENDLILAGVFILTAWPLGYYVKIESENLARKDLQLKELNEELNKKDQQRRYIEKMLFKNETCYNLLINNSRDAIMVHRDGNLIFGNESAVEVLGFNSVEDIIGKSILEFIPTDERDKMKNIFGEIYDRKTSMLSFEEKVLKSDGSIIIMQNTSTYFVYEGKLTILSILHDITSEKQVEKLQKDVEKNIELLNETREVNKLITEFLSNISHELKTPLNVIFSAVQLLNIYNNEEKDNIQNRDKYLKVMKQNCYRLMRLINNLLDVTRLESGFLRLNVENDNIVNIVEEITMSVVTYVESKGLKLTFDTDIEEKIMAFDPDKIERIVLNILSNAIKFTNPGGNIYVQVKDMGSDILISIKDTGIGIPKDKLQLIFERFGQVNKTFRRNREGSGIGLYLVKSFVEMHGGSIQVKSKLGEGSEFLIRLPAKSTKEEVCKKDSLYEANIESISIEFSDIYSDVTPT
ncbi:PAS domain S-box-containing protein [Clostridium tetanomorphum]|uniref:PAS domain-containing sensor histidine kinase n=1 Tax=Clostridium tetanomorphum TaxID=1553 RepID=UPI00044E4690|nr:PAS domain-containing sensor histidine kinase [Clostridium tetanomorphum]KAJ50111.1 sensory box histidine kinase [Clostridium tetanomorphum DSM 665]MBP1862856.1 PAS domain S-box-containing protein [Clostridium tetanomorphum]NRS86993.1 PAS domain S-box-containing protein [Clostridium tetanomorphum]SQC00203.1 sensory box histidine kinase [Clostridium tetanomorphum]